MKDWKWLWAARGAWLIGLGSCLRGGESNLEAVLTAGEQIHGLGTTVQWKDFKVAVLGSRGALSCIGGIAGGGVKPGTDDEVLFRASDDGGWVLARKGEPVVGVADPPSALFVPVLDRDGNALVQAVLPPAADGSAQGTAAWIHGAGGAAHVIHNGANAPGLGEDVQFAGASQVLLADDGQLLVWGALAGRGVTESNNFAIWTGAPGRLSLLARVGDSAPGTSEVYGSLLSPVIASDGIVAFWAALRSPSTPAERVASLWLMRPATAALVARGGDPAPGTVPGVKFGGAILSLGFPGVNRAGEVAFAARLSGPDVTADNDTGFWFGRPGELRLLARAGDQAPGTPEGVRFAPANGVFDGPWVSAGGEVLIASRLQGSGVDDGNDAGLWLGMPGNVRLVAREGMAAPGLDGALQLGPPGRPNINARGDIAFTASVRDSQGMAEEKRGLWHWRDGTLLPVVVEGQTLTLNASELPVVRRVRAITFAADISGATGGDDGRPRALADDGTVAFVAEFEDGGEAVFVARRLECPGPHLQIRIRDAALRVQFRRGLDCHYALESAPFAAPSAAWREETPAMTVGEDVVTMELPAEGEQRFYRVRVR